MSHMRSASVMGFWGAFFAVDSGRVCHAETLERMVAYFDSCSPVSGDGGGTFDGGSG